MRGRQPDPEMNGAQPGRGKNSGGLYDPLIWENMLQCSRLILLEVIVHFAIDFSPEAFRQIFKVN